MLSFLGPKTTKTSVATVALVNRVSKHVIILGCEDPPPPSDKVMSLPDFVEAMKN